MTLEEMYRLFFGSQIKCPDTIGDAGLSCNRPDTQVSSPLAEHIVYLSQHHFEKSLFDQDWVKKAKMIRCSAPLPGGSTDLVLARMLELAPYQAPSGEDKGGNKEAESGPHSLFIQSGAISASTKEDNRGEESEIPSRQGRKRTTSEDLEIMVSKRGKKSSPEGLGSEGTLGAQCPQGDQPSTEL